MIRALIIEDETSLRTLVKKFVQEIDKDIDIVAEAGNVLEAIKAINNNDPDIIFLDIMLPGGTGFDVLDSLKELRSEVVFITAYDKYFLEAFKHSAVGYVLKPVDKAELAIAINNAKKRISDKKQNEQVATLLDFIKKQNNSDGNEKIGIPTPDGFIFLAPEEIIRCEGQNAYTRIFMADKSDIISSYNLAQFKKILPEELFFQVHKSHIISMPNVRKYNAKEALVEMDNGDSIPISRKIKTDFISHFKIPKR